MIIKDPKAEYRRLVSQEIEMRKMYRAAIYDQMYNAATIRLDYFDGFTSALEGALGISSREKLSIIESILAAGED